MHNVSVPADRINPQFSIHHRHPHVLPRIRNIHQLHIRILLQFLGHFAQGGKKRPHLGRRMIQRTLRHKMHSQRHYRRRQPEVHMRSARPMFIRVHANHSFVKHVHARYRHRRPKSQRRLRQYQHAPSHPRSGHFQAPPDKGMGGQPHRFYLNQFQFSNFNFLLFSPPCSSNPPRSVPYSRRPSPSPVPCPHAPKAPSVPPRCPAHPCPPKTVHPPPSSAP